MNDEELFTAFENGSLPADAWNHRAHVIVAVSYLMRLGLEDAIVQIRRGIQYQNTRHGVQDTPTQGYHETTTQAFMRLIQATMISWGPFQNPSDFCNRCPQLLNRRVLLCYYSRDCIMQPQAKSTFVEPDLAPFDRVGLRYTGDGHG
jgi:hypothetical protein